MTNYMKHISTEDIKSTPKTVIAITGPAGAGKTTILTNIAALLSKNSTYSPSICILDMNLIFPSTSYMVHFDDCMNEPTEKNDLHFLLNNYSTLSNEEIKRHAMVHIPTKLHFFKTEKTKVYEIVSSVKGEDIKGLIKRLKECYDIVLIDTSSDINKEENLVPLKEADKILGVVEHSFNKLFEMRTMIKLMRLMDINMNEKDSLFSKLQIIGNKHVEGKSLDAYNLQRTLFDKPLTKIIEYNSEILVWQNHGNLLTEGRNKTAEELLDIARTLYPFEKEEVLPILDIEISKEKWIEIHGSEHLKNCSIHGYDAQRLYVEERSAGEFPDFTLDFENQSEWRSRSCPSQHALKIEMDYREQHGNKFDIQVVWMVKPPHSMKKTTTENEWKAWEAVVIKNYLGKYTLVKEM